jgi:hypothetical protein
MAQTRAVSKALRLPLGFIMHLAGYSATPAEELADEQPERARGGSPSSPSASAPAPRNKGDALERLAEVARDHNLSFAQVDAKARELGVDRRTGGVEDILRLIAAIESERAGSAPESAPSTPQAERSIPAAATSAAAEDDGVPPATSSEPSAAPSLDDVLAVSGGEVIPPKPGTKAYRDLPNGTERANAKAYWDKKPEPEQESLAMALGGPES